MPSSNTRPTVGASSPSTISQQRGFAASRTADDGNEIVIGNGKHRRLQRFGRWTPAHSKRARYTVDQ